MGWMHAVFVRVSATLSTGSVSVVLFFGDSIIYSPFVMRARAMSEATVGQHIVQQTAETLRAKPFTVTAQVAENHVGPYVEVQVPDATSRNKMYDEIDQYPCYIDVVTETPE